MKRRSRSPSYRRSRRSRSEDRRSDERKGEDERDKRRQAWLIQQEREREHEILKKRMILEYELKRAALLQEKKTDDSRQSPSKSPTKSKHRSKSSPRPMSEKLETPGGKEPLFRGPSTSARPTEAELRQIKVDIHRNISGPVDIINDLQRGILNPEDVRVKRREDEGQRPLFERLNLNESGLSEPSGEETRTIRSTINEKEAEPKRRSSSAESRSTSKKHTSSSIPIQDIENGNTNVIERRNCDNGRHTEDDMV